MIFKIEIRLMIEIGPTLHLDVHLPVHVVYQLCQAYQPRQFEKMEVGALKRMIDALIDGWTDK